MEKAKVAASQPVSVELDEVQRILVVCLRALPNPAVFATCSHQGNGHKSAGFQGRQERRSLALYVQTDEDPALLRWQSRLA